jgi:hypothetical protein
MRQANRRRWKQSVRHGPQDTEGLRSGRILHWKVCKKIPPWRILGPVEQLAQKGEVYLILKIFLNADFICENLFHKISIIFSGLRDIFSVVSSC